MARNFELVLKGGTVVNQDGMGVRDVGIRDGRIAAIGAIDPQKAGEVIDNEDTKFKLGVRFFVEGAVG